MEYKEIFVKNEQEAKAVAEKMAMERPGFRACIKERDCTCGRRHKAYVIGRYDRDGIWEECAVVIPCNQGKLDFGKEDEL